MPRKFKEDTEDSDFKEAKGYSVTKDSSY